MPLKVDHEERRKQIAEAVLRIAEGQSLREVTMRGVAAEAGVSLRLVQYYFQSKDALLVDALERLSAQLDARMRQSIAAAEAPPTPRTIVTAVLTNILPIDAESRRIARTYAAFYSFVLSDPQFAEKHGTPQPDTLEAFLAKQIRAAQQAGEVPAEVDPKVKAAGLLAMTNGLVSSVLGKQRTGETALAILTSHLDELWR
ncbi:TetR/AcrR family transcriptional regulator [Nonomuraea sp. NPDC049400]|uniref:TetR/AcrR family transcriptional regulator n=1 Tax=Nonomuraea sp. NPDC049400 TaxID=3364352 RepID=UPI00379BCC2C